MTVAGFDTLRWRDGHLELIDQRLLPGECRYLACDSAKAVAEAIRGMAVRGAPAIGCAAAYGVALEAHRLRSAGPEKFESGLERAFQLLAGSRPTAANLFWALDRMRRNRDGRRDGDPKAIAAGLLKEAHAILQEDVRLNRRMGEHGAALLDDGMQVLTHCNAGALATAGHGTALGVIRSAVAAGKSISVVVDETRPFLQGARLTAWELAQDGIPVTLIADSAAGHFMRRGEIDAVIVGADRVAANGDVANKIGTYTVAVLAQRHSVPFYVACPLSTIDLGVASGADIPIEERGAEEVTGYRDVRWAPAEVTARNPVFDVTPAALVTALVTEKGVINAPDRNKIMALFQ
ncbi:MAG: S-methyl-5-thioribose-1-phosphate isomerase [Betaproteobacteria bacterium]|nr:S-methyl-5-thioribose-1-phosphate isomerase [Betaproteobacteria bacterium]